jgi:hypothetical protein
MRLTSRLFRPLGTVLLPLSMLAGVAALPTGVSAAAPQHVNFSGTIPNVDLCGFNTTLTYSGVDTFTPVFDSAGNLVAFKDLHQEQDTYTTTNGQSITIHSGGMQTGTFTLNPDGTLATTLITYKGLPEQLKTPNGPVLTQDAGIITFFNLFDSSGNFISQTVTAESGPHPEADSGFTLFCQAVTAALS